MLRHVLDEPVLEALIGYGCHPADGLVRIEAFLKLGRKDPVAYANSEGPVSWEVAKAHVESVLSEWGSRVTT